MSTISELRVVFKDAVAYTTRVLDEAAAMEALLAKGEEGRTDRAENRPIEVLEVQQIENRILGKVQGVEGVYHPRISISPRRFACDCPDSKIRGRQIGPCKHTLALAKHWRDRIQPDLERVHQALVSVMF